MELYFAPMEGVTDYIYRRIHRRYFPGVDKYFTPFLSPTQNHIFPPRELRQVLPENNAGIPLVPQLLTKNAADFLWAAGALADMGYGEVNLNVGCPSGTVTAKGKGAGLLADPAVFSRARGERVEPDALRQFHEELCDAYCAAFGGPGSAIHRMKAIWSYLLQGLAGGAAWEKRLGRTRRWPEFLALTDEILSTLPPATPEGPSSWEPPDQIYSF